jgi:hypothetical protein
MVLQDDADVVVEIVLRGPLWVPYVEAYREPSREHCSTVSIRVKHAWREGRKKVRGCWTRWDKWGEEGVRERV